MVREADDIRQKTGRAFFDLDNRLVPHNWHDLSSAEKEAEFWKREKVLMDSPEAKAFESAKEAFMSTCLNLISFNLYGHDANIERSEEADRELQEYLVFKEVDLILDQNLFSGHNVSNGFIKTTDDKRMVGILFPNMHLERLAGRIIEDVKSSEFSGVYLFGSINAVAVEITASNTTEAIDLAQRAIDAAKLSVRARVRCVHEALVERDRELIEWIEKFAKSHHVGLNYEPQTIAEGVSRGNRKLKQKKSKIKKSEPRVC